MMFLKFDLKKNASILSILICLTFIAVAAQITFFTIHYKVSDLLDSFVQSSLKAEMIHSVILLPLLGFFLIQLASYAVFVAWVWFVSISISELFKFSKRVTFWVSLLLWFICCSTILSLNNYYYPDSFFASLIPTNTIFLVISVFLSLSTAFAAYINCLKNKSYRLIGSIFLCLGAIMAGFGLYDYFAARVTPKVNPHHSNPNIILIGLDSVRPDFVSYFGNHSLSTPHIDAFLKKATIFTEAYTPLARTFTSWMSILTAQHPKHSNARSNLSNPNTIRTKETLAARLKAAGYETIYATDEKRFSNITEHYGFDRIIGPGLGVNDFILGGLNDYPLTNLLINTSLGRILFPYNYANRAAAITYEPDKFIQLVKLGLTTRSDKPLFLAIHLCVSHWPFTWARDKQPKNATLPQRYQSSVEAVDKQLGELLQILKADGLLEHSFVVLLSDHGTTLGLPHDRIISDKTYLGERDKLKLISVFKLSSAPNLSFNFKHDYSLDTSYGQGTDVLSLKQFHVLLAMQGFGINTIAKQISSRASLMDIAPTTLELLNLIPMKITDGVSFKPSLFSLATQTTSQRPLFLETGHSISEIQTKDIFIENVIKKTIGVYQINPSSGQLFVKSAAEQSINQSKQRAVLLGDWLLARYPATTKTIMASSKEKNTSSIKLSLEPQTYPPFFVIANLKTGEWSIDFSSSLAKKAPIIELSKKFNDFYGDEIS